jgi:hypothetical protein
MKQCRRISMYMRRVYQVYAALFGRSTQFQGQRDVNFQPAICIRLYRHLSYVLVRAGDTHSPHRVTTVLTSKAHHTMVRWYE